MSAPYGVTVNVYLPLISLSLGYAQVQGLWQDAGRPYLQHFETRRAPQTQWQKLPAGRAYDWEQEQP